MTVSLVRRIFDLLPVGVIHTRADGTIRDANSILVRMLGYESLDELRNVGAAALWAEPGDRARLIERLLRERSSVGLEMRFRRKDGAVIWVRSNARVITSRRGQPIEFEATLEDVTDRRRLAERLEEAERFAHLGRWEVDCDVPADVDDGALVWSDETYRLFGFEPGEVAPDRRLVASMLHPDDREALRRGMKAAVDSAQPHEATYRMFRRDGQMRFFHVRGRSEEMAMPRGVRRLVGTVRDVTDQMRADEAVRLKRSFLANLNHEVRTPLNVILGFTRLVADRLHEAGDPTEHEYIEVIDEAGRRLMATIDGTLDMAKFETHSFEVSPVLLELSAVVPGRVRDFEPRARKKGVHLETWTEAGEAVISFDEYCLVHALGNLVDNAIKFTGAGGSVVVRLRRDDSGPVVLEVEDTGVGIAPDFLGKLFEPYSQEESGYSRRFEGAGLGLALVKRYVEANGAEIEVASEKGRGSVFRIRFAV